MSNKLKSCPFCGGEAELTTGSVFMWEHIVVCKDCGASSKMIGGITPSQARAKAIATWNTRKPVDRVLEQLEEQQKLYKEAWENTDWVPDKTVYINMARGFEQAIKIIKEGMR